MKVLEFTNGICICFKRMQMLSDGWCLLTGVDDDDFELACGSGLPVSLDEDMESVLVELSLINQIL